MSAKLLDTVDVATEVGSVRVARNGPPGDPLVFVHGYPDNLQIWSRVFAALAPEHPVVAFDWPGLGHSEPIIGGATSFHLGRHLIAVLDALDIERAIPVGFDMGAHAVVAAAHRAPERFAKLVLTNFLADGTVATSWDISLMRRLGLNRLVLRYGARIVFERAQRTFLERGRLPSHIADDLWQGFRRNDVRGHLRRMCAGYQAALPRVTKLFGEIDIDTMVLWADADPHFPLAQADALAEALPSAQLRTLEGASHWFMWDRPDEVAQALLEFTA